MAAGSAVSGTGGSSSVSSSEDRWLYRPVAMASGQMTPVEAATVLATTAVALAIFLATARWVGNRWYAEAGAVALLGHVAFGSLVLPRLP
jgi:hypothetical protein